jgi:hypothetical protein
MFFSRRAYALVFIEVAAEPAIVPAEEIPEAALALAFFSLCFKSSLFLMDSAVAYALSFRLLFA